jgi:hypothetical protein
MIYYGDFAVGATLYASFNTVNAVGAPTSFDASSVVKVYKKGSGAESTAGVTLNADFDGRSGMHELEIDTSADGSFYDAGSDFYAVLTTGAVGGVSLVGLIVAHFSIAARYVVSVPTANQNADALLDRADAIETGLTVRQSQRLVAAAAAGNVNGSGGTVKNVGNSKTRINFSGDGTNRTVSSTDVT